MKKCDYLLKFVNFIDSFIDGSISAVEFCDAITVLVKSQKNVDISVSEFKIIDDLWDLTFRYQPDKALRMRLPDLLDEDQLREELQYFKRELNQLLKNEK